MVVILIVTICSQAILLVIIRVPRNPRNRSDIFQMLVIGIGRCSFLLKRALHRSVGMRRGGLLFVFHVVLDTAHSISFIVGEKSSSRGAGVRKGEGTKEVEVAFRNILRRGCWLPIYWITTPRDKEKGRAPLQPPCPVTGPRNIEPGGWRNESTCFPQKDGLDRGEATSLRQ
jgi:hypothetical protein